MLHAYLHAASETLQQMSDKTCYCVIVAHTVSQKPGSCNQTVPPLCGCETVWRMRLQLNMHQQLCNAQKAKILLSHISDVASLNQEVGE